MNENNKTTTRLLMNSYIEYLCAGHKKEEIKDKIIFDIYNDKYRKLDGINYSIFTKEEKELIINFLNNLI